MHYTTDMSERMNGKGYPPPFFFLKRSSFYDMGNIDSFK